MKISKTQAGRLVGATAIAVAGSLALFGANGVFAQSASAGAGTASKNMARGDRKFVEEAAKGGMAEVEMGKLGQQSGSSEQVKQFGARIVQDHTKANDELKSLASSKSMSLPDAMPKVQKDMDKMGKKSGADFDRAYMKHMVADHKKDISLFEKEAKSGNDPDLKAFATKTLPTLREHLQMAQSANDTLKNAK